MWNSIDNNYEIKIHILIKTGGLQKKNRPTKFVNCPCGTDDLECYGGRRRFVKYTQFVDMSIFSSLENCFKRSNENRKLKVIPNLYVIINNNLNLLSLNRFSIFVKLFWNPYNQILALTTNSANKF
jgi:hypothetical protein